VKKVAISRIESVEDLERIIDGQTVLIDELGTLVKLMDARVRLYTALIDAHHEIFISHGWASPRPKADPFAN
jgi:hypothetical protein